MSLLLCLSVFGSLAGVKDELPQLSAPGTSASKSDAEVFGDKNVGEMSVMHPKSMLIANKSIGNKVVVGAASVVMRNIKDEWHVHGNPAIRMEY